MLKGQEIDVADLANRYSLNNFVHFKVTLRDKLFFELGVINTTIDFGFENKKVKTRNVIYACNTKWIYKQSLPPGYESGFVSYHVMENTYDFEISYMDILVEYSPREGEILEKDADADATQVRKLFSKVMENFAYKYNEAAAGGSYLEPVFYSTTAFSYRCFYRDCITGEFNFHTGRIYPAVGDKERITTKMWDINSTLDNQYVMWRFYLNKARYYFSIRMYIDCILYAAISIESYLIQIIKDNGTYEEYLTYAGDGNKGFTSAKNYIRTKALLPTETINLLDKTYKKIREHRTKIVHGDTETPYLERSIAERVYQALEETFEEIETLYAQKIEQDTGLAHQKSKYHTMAKIKKIWDDGRYSEALGCLSENIVNDMYVDLSYFNRAHCYSKRGLSKEAIEDFKMCVKKRVMLKDTYKGLAQEYCKISGFANAKEIYDLAIKVDNTNARLYFFSANVLIKLEEYCEAKEKATKAIEIEPQADYYYVRAVAEAYLQQKKEAIEDYSTAICKESNISRYWLGRGQIYLELDMPEYAEKDIRTAVKLEEKSGNKQSVQELLVATILMYLKQNKKEEAIRMCNDCQMLLVNNRNYNVLVQKMSE